MKTPKLVRVIPSNKPLTRSHAEDSRFAVAASTPHPAKDHTDAHAVRFFEDNDRICDHARPDETAGLHKYAVETNENRGVIVCVCCGLTRSEKPDDAGQWYMVEVSA